MSILLIPIVVRYPVAQLILARKVSFVTHVDNISSSICETYLNERERKTKIEDRGVKEQALTITMTSL